MLLNVAATESRVSTKALETELPTTIHSMAMPFSSSSSIQPASQHTGYCCGLNYTYIRSRTNQRRTKIQCMLDLKSNLYFMSILHTILQNKRCPKLSILQTISL